MRDEVSMEPTEAAKYWFEILSQYRLSAEQRAEFAKWINYSPLHITEFLNVSTGRSSSYAR